MTFKELAQQTSETLVGIHPGTEKTWWQILVDNNGPLMTVWFVIMALNLIGLMILF